MKFNFLKKSNTILKNYEGAPSYQLSPEMELYSATVTSLLHDSFYEKAEERLKVIKNFQYFKSNRQRHIYLYLKWQTVQFNKHTTCIS